MMWGWFGDRVRVLFCGECEGKEVGDKYGRVGWAFMTVLQMTELSRIVNAHYGKALKKDSREGSGNITVYGSSGIIGAHSETLCDFPTIVIG